MKRRGQHGARPLKGALILAFNLKTLFRTLGPTMESASTSSFHVSIMYRPMLTSRTALFHFTASTSSQLCLQKSRDSFLSDRSLATLCYQ